MTKFTRPYHHLSPNLKTLMASFSLSFFLGCNAASKGPEIPEPLEGLGSNERPGEGDLEASSLSPPRDKYADLPTTFREGIRECENIGRYYDISSAECTPMNLAQYECKLETLLAEGSVLSEALKIKLKSYVESNLVGYTLFACTETAEEHELHFYQAATEKVRAYNVKLMKSAEGS